MKFKTVLVVSLIYLNSLLSVSLENESETDNSSRGRDRSHIEAKLAPFTQPKEQERLTRDTLDQLVSLCQQKVKPMDDLYRFSSLNRHTVSEGAIKANPMVLFVGPWSTGKTTMINYILGIDDPSYMLRTGAEPTTSDFTVLLHGNRYQPVEGLVLASDPSRQFSSLEKFGQGFLEKFQGYEMPTKLLKRATLVDTPGIIENRKQQERGYPYNDVMKWFIDRADLIVVVFDPSKLDVGTELESLFRQLKGRESQIRIVLNKADSIKTHELMRVYGALFWNLAPLINVTEPPRVYTGSFWPQTFKPGTGHELFQFEEDSLLQDLHHTITNLVENKIASTRQHAIQVRIHALIVDRFLEVFNSEKSVFGDNEPLLNNIIEHPEKYHVFSPLSTELFVSKYDLPDPKIYRDFFATNALNLFKPLKSYCSYLRGCPMDSLLQTIAVDLPRLLRSFRHTYCAAESCDKPGT